MQYVKRRRRYEDLVDTISEAIRRGELAPGTRLASERDLAEQFAVSRSTVREAMKVLASRGLIEIESGGNFVRKTSLVQVARQITDLVIVSTGDLLHLLEVRRILETQAVRLAVERATETDLMEIYETMLSHEKAQLSGADSDIHPLDSQFHFSLVRAAQNPLLTEFMQVIRDFMGGPYSRYRRVLVGEKERIPMWLQQHRRIYQAISERDPEAAAAAVEEHLRSVEAIVRIGAFHEEALAASHSRG